jgi:phosphopantetheinyl transferase
MAPRAIGVDIEPIRAFAALAPRSIAAALTQRERDLLATVGDDGGRLLCQLWCLKEALGKARGGQSAPLVLPMVNRHEREREAPRRTIRRDAKEGGRVTGIRSPGDGSCG